MALTETRPAAAAGTAGATAAAPVRRTELTGLAGLLTTGSSVRVGTAWIVASLLFAVAAGVAGELVAAERIQTDGLQVLGDDVVGQVWSFHGVSAVLLFVLPLFVGIATAVVPLQVGATTIAFPRAAAAAFWGWLLGGGLLVGAYVANGGPGGGDPNAVELFLLAMVIVVVSILLAAVCIATTVLTLRAPGLTLGRAPIFSWAMLVASAMWLVTLPVLVANLVVTYLDHRYGQSFLGGATGVGRQIGWAFGAPQIYVYAIPALGVIGEAVPVFTGFRQRRHGAVMAAIAVFAVLSFGAYAQPFAAVDTTERVEMVELSIVLLLPLLALVALWGDTLRRRRPRAAAPMVFAGGALLMLLAGTAAGAVSAVEALDLQGTTWETGELHYVLMGGAGLAALGALHYWVPKIWGRRLSSGLGVVEGLLLLLGVVLLSLPDLVSGALDQPAGLLEGEVRDGVELANVASALGGGLVLLAVVVLLVDIVVRVVRRRGEAAGDDPWEGHTLEWATTSPPTYGTTGDLPPITSAAPLLDRRSAGADREVV